MVTTDATGSSCSNCGTPLAGPYCYSCGQKATPLAPTLGSLFRELTHELLNVDGKIFRSVRLLLTRPGFLTLEIFAGRRERYVSPIRLYLIFSLLAFGVGAIGVIDTGEVLITYTPDAGEVVTPEIEAQTAETAQSVNAALRVWVPRAMFLLVPLFAALVMLFRRGSGRTYPQHLYFAVHVHAVWLFANAMNTLFQAVPLPYVTAISGTVFFLYALGYFVIAFHRVYATPARSDNQRLPRALWGTLWRTGLIGLIYWLFLIFTLLVIVIPFIFGFEAPGS